MSNHFNTFARSYLFVPGSRPDRITKALDSGAHAVIVDLEDAVAPEEKLDSRQQVAAWVKENPARPILLRINAFGTPWHDEDLRLATAPNVVGVVLPKAEKAQALALIADKPVLPMIESALGFSEINAIAAHPATKRLIFGTYDFCADLGLAQSNEALLYFASKIVLVSRVAGLAPPVDGVMAKLSDESGWLTEARRARDLGFGGKLCIHPRQVSAINDGFSPSAKEISWAKKVISGAGDQATAVVDGQFVDRPVLLRARAILQQTELCVSMSASF